MKSTTFNAAILFFATFLFTQVTSAQSSFFIGPMATGHISSQKTSDYFTQFNQWGTDGNNVFPFYQEMETKSLLNLSGGVSFGFQFGRFSLVSGARFFQKGIKQESREFLLFEETQVDDLYYFDEYAILDIGTLKLTERQNFIHIPLLARYQFLGDDFGVTLALGPAFNIGIGNAKSDWNADGKTYGEKDNGAFERTFGKDLDNMYKPMQTSFIVSPGVVFPVGDQGKLHVNLFWETHLSSSLNDKYIDQMIINGELYNQYRPEGEQRSRSIGIGITYEHHLDLNIGSKY